MPKGPSIWDYYEKNTDSSEKRATCKLCFEEKSYATSITNLKQHLRFKHSEVAHNFADTSSATKNHHQTQSPIKKTRNVYNIIWSYFTKSGKHKIGICNLCCKGISYKTTVTNLKCHLLNKHSEIHKNRFLQGLPPLSSDLKLINRNESCEDSESDHEAEDTEKQNDIWNFFEQEDGSTHCAICRDVIEDASYDGLKAHMFTEHPKLLLQHVQEQEQDSPEEMHLNFNSASEDEDNTFTEVVYLEQDSPEDSPTKKRKYIKNYNSKRNKKRIRNDSSSEQEKPIKMKREKEDTQREEDGELDVFLKYIRCLLKKLSPDGFTKVQVDVFKIVMDAILADKIPVPEVDQSSVTNILTDVGNSVGDVIKINDIHAAHNYSIKLINSETAHVEEINVKQN